jgi:hypothetical protein
MSVSFIKCIYIKTLIILLFFQIFQTQAITKSWASEEYQFKKAQSL